MFFKLNSTPKLLITSKCPYCIRSGRNLDFPGFFQKCLCHWPLCAHFSKSVHICLQSVLTILQPSSSWCCNRVSSTVFPRRCKLLLLSVVAVVSSCCYQLLLLSVVAVVSFWYCCDADLKYKVNQISTCFERQVINKIWNYAQFMVKAYRVTYNISDRFMR